MCDDFGFTDDPFKVFDTSSRSSSDMHEFGHGKRDGFSVASNATATTRSTCSSEESSGSKLRSGSSSKDKGTSSRRLRAAGPPRTTSAREGCSSSRTSNREGPSRARSSREGLSKQESSASGEFGSFGSNAFDSSAFTDFSEPFGMQTAPAAAPSPAPVSAAATPKQRPRRRASVAGGTPVAPAAAPVVPPSGQLTDFVEAPRRVMDRQRSRSGERSVVSMDSRRTGSRRTTRRGSNGDSGAAASADGPSRSKSSQAFMGFDCPSNTTNRADMFGFTDGSATGAADYGYGGNASTADFGYEPATEEMGYGYGDDDAPPKSKAAEVPRAKLSRARRSSIGVTQFGGSSDAFLNDLCGKSTEDLMTEKVFEKPKPKPANTGPSIAMPLAEGSSSKATAGGVGGAARRGGRRASLIGGMNVGVGVLTNGVGALTNGVGALTNKQAEKLDDPDSARKSKASFFKDRSASAGDNNKGKAATSSRNKSGSDGIQSYNPDRDRRQMMKD